MMRISSGSRISGLLLLAAAVALPLSGMANSAEAAGPVYSAPGQYYLALGDSLGYGYQQPKFDALKAAGTLSPSAFNTGYVDDFAAMLRIIRPGIQTVNYSCPGETTTSFIQGGCQFPGALLHNPYSGPQLQAALAFLQAHPGQVNPITLSIGANDLNAIAAACGGLNLGCVAPKVPAAVALVGKNLTQMLGALRQAAPNSEIILLQPYNPYAVADVATNPLAEALNKVTGQVAGAFGVITVNAYNSFNLATPQPQTLCRLTNFCLTPASGEGPDIHASDAGYAVIANLTWAAAGYARYGNLAVVGFDSAKPGQGQVYFGAGPTCTGLYAVATQDLHPGTTTHVVLITGNDLAGSTGGGSLLAGVTYAYQTVTWSAAGMETDNNAGSCYTLTTASS